MTYDEADFNALEPGVAWFLGSLIDENNPNITETVQGILNKFRVGLRQPISINEFQDFQFSNRTLSLSEVIKNFHLEKDSVKPWRGGWLKVKLAKTGSETYLFFKPSSDGQFKILFFNDGISPESLDTYKKAASVMPEYISAPVYLELQNKQNNPRILFRRQGYREVYAGPDLTNVGLDTLPKIIKTNIFSQQEYVWLVLRMYDINHRHTHYGNFNVRFLLTDADGNKKLSFDANEAIRLAKENELSLTPIVILRDWDKASLKTDKT